MSVARFCVCGFLLPAGHDGAQPCPACGRFDAPRVAVPKFQTPIATAGAKPLTFQAVEIGDDGKPVPPKPPPTDEELERRADEYRSVRAEYHRREERRRRLFANRWPDPGSFQDCFTFPLRSMLWVMLLAWAWAILLIVAVHVAGPTFDSVLIDLLLSGIGIIVLGFTHRIFEYVHASSQQRCSVALTWPTFHLVAELRAGLTGLVGLLAGPIPVAVLAAWYWLYCGRVDGVDRLIVFELAVVSLTWWMLSILAVHEFGSVNPRFLLKWFDRHGWLPLAVIGGAMTCVAVIFWFLIVTLSTGRNEFIVIQAVFTPAALVATFAIAFMLFRWLGVRNAITASAGGRR